MVVILAVIIIPLDLLTKYWAKQTNLTLTYNQGLAFSIPTHPIAGIVITTILLVVLFLYYKKLEEQLTKKQEVAFGLILGGALSNLLERAYIGHVTDFIKIGAGYLNFADLAIFAGIGILLVSVLKIDNWKLKI